MHIEVRDCPRINGKEGKTHFGIAMSLTSDLLPPPETSGSSHCTSCSGPFKGFPWPLKPPCQLSSFLWISLSVGCSLQCPWDRFYQFWIAHFERNIQTKERSLCFCSHACFTCMLSLLVLLKIYLLRFFAHIFLYTKIFPIAFPTDFPNWIISLLALNL